MAAAGLEAGARGPERRRHEASDEVVAGRYLLGRRLGGGGLCEVFAARQLALRRDVAIKRPRAPGRGGDEQLAHEARVLARLAHPAVVTVHEVGVDRGRPFLVLERVRGRPLAALGRERAWSAAAVAEVLAAIAAALDHVHRRGWAHGDLKPDNVLVGAQTAGDGAAASLPVKLIDFGEAQPLSAPEARPRVWGDARHLAPERRRGEPASVAADLWGLGAIGWALVFGRAFPGAATPPRGWTPSGPVAAALQAVVLGLCADDAGRRPPSAEAAAQALGGIVAAASRLPAEPAARAQRRLTRPRPRAVSRAEHVGVRAPR